MAESLTAQSSWESIEWDSRAAYTRPLVGSELLSDQFHRYHDGATDVCHGLDLTSPLSVDEVYPKLVDAVARLRFISPIIGATLSAGLHDDRLRSWVYTPISNAGEARHWAENAVTVLDERVDSASFIEKTVQRRLPYILSDGTQQLIRFYFFQRLGEQEDAYSLFLHGPHCILDARPTLDLLWMMLHSICESFPASLESLEWGNEWKNLPMGPVVACGGLRPNWEGEGSPALEKIIAILSNPVPTLSIKPQRSVEVVGKSHRLVKVFGEKESAEILRETKAAGCTVTHLFEAAQMIAIVARNPELNVKSSEAHVTYPISFISLDKFRVPPYNTRAHAVSAMAELPITAPYDEVPDSTTANKHLLVMLMRRLKDQYDEYLGNPHLPYLTTALLKIAPPYEPVNRNPHAAVITNIGLIENIIKTTWYKNNDNESGSPPIFTITSMPFGHRLTSLTPGTHVWTFKSRLTVQVQAADIWDESYLEDFLLDIMRFASLIISS